MTTSFLRRIIGHLDLDYFYAQVEELEKPSLKGAPVIVCVFSGRTDDSGVVGTANYRAREFGVRAGMPIATAKKRLSGASPAIIPMRHEKYEAYSERVMEVLRPEVDVLEQASIDEAFFDVTRKTNGDYTSASAFAAEIKETILKDVGLTCSIGLGPNKVVAKIASDFKKPDGLTVVDEEHARAFLATLPIETIYGLGPKTAKALTAIGITTMPELAAAPIEKTTEVLGKRLAVYLHNAANVSDDEPVVDRVGVSQLSRIITLKEDSHDPRLISAQLIPALHDLHEKLVSRGLFFRSVSALGIGRDLSLRTKSKTLERPTNDYSLLERELAELFGTLTADRADLRRVGVRVGDLKDMTDQASLTEFTI